MSDANGKPPPDPALLTPNDWRRLRVALGGRDPQEMMGSDAVEDMYQLLILAYQLRTDPAFTWDQAGDVVPATVFDFTAPGGQSPPDLPDPTSSENGSSPKSNDAPTSKKKPTGSGRGRSSASTTASASPNTTR